MGCISSCTVSSNEWCLHLQADQMLNNSHIIPQWTVLVSSLPVSVYSLSKLLARVHPRHYWRKVHAQTGPDVAVRRSGGRSSLSSYTWFIVLSTLAQLTRVLKRTWLFFVSMNWQWYQLVWCCSTISPALQHTQGFTLLWFFFGSWPIDFFQVNAEFVLSNY